MNSSGREEQMNRTAAIECFQDYTGRYNPDDPMIRHKIVHTFSVAGLSEKIALSLGLDGKDVDFAWFLGLLHDIGRFEQVRRYGTFVDSQSVDHAEFGADLLFRDGLFRFFPTDDLSPEQRQTAETAIRLHNKLSLPENLDGETRCFSQILRDADKVDIFRVVAEIPFEERIGKSRGLLSETEEASPEVLECVSGHRCVPRAARHTVLDGLIAHACMAFELVFEESRRLAREQGNLKKLLSGTDENGRPLWGPAASEQLRAVEKEIETAWNMTL